MATAGGSPKREYWQDASDQPVIRRFLRSIWRKAAAWIVRSIPIPHEPYTGPTLTTVDPDMYGMTVADELRVMAGLWQQEAEWIDGYRAAAYDLMDYLGVKHERAEASDIKCPNCKDYAWRLDRYCSNCGEKLPEKEWGDE
ncbi:hypothetical protein KKE60_05200 [Patescibacteria group bacterium]|nr:hypothetical protein [Patescibacteria group bacterium]